MGGSKQCRRCQNPCKICLESVKPKTGLQCQGACESWVHYGCLNYTPGKIKDIKTGEITVTCPCPDCKLSVPKEIRSNEPYSCNNVKCPANKAPACDNAACQANEITNSRPPPYRPGQLLNCGADCRAFMPPSGFASLPSDPCMEGFNVGGPGNGPKPNMSGLGANMNANTGLMPSINTVKQLSNTVGELTNQINDLMSKMTQAMGGNDGGPMGGLGGGGLGGAGGMGGLGGGLGMGGLGGGRLGGGGLGMGGLVGGLPPNGQICPQTGPKTLCPKPCFCPGNPPGGLPR